MADKDEQADGVERRTTKRRIISESFNFFVVIPKVLGMSRVYMRDISTGGLCIHVDTNEGFAMEQDVNLRIYTGPGFYLPVSAKVRRLADSEVAFAYTNQNEKAVRALAKFLEFLDLAAEAVVMKSPSV